MIRILFLFLTTIFLVLQGICDNTSDSLAKKLTSSSGEEKFNLLIALAKHHSRSDIQKSFDYAQQANIYAVESENRDWIANSLNVLAICYYNMGKNYDALKYFMRFVDEVKSMLDENPESEAINNKLITGYNNIGNIYKAIGDHEQAMKVFLEGFRLMDSLNLEESNPGLYLNLLNNLGLVYFDLGEFEQAREMFFNALEKSRLKKMDLQISIVLNNLGLIAIEKKEYSDAVKYYSEAVEIGKSLNDSIALQGYYNNLGLIYEKQGNYDNALDYYKQSLRLSRSLGYKWGIANTLGNMANINIQTGKYSEAELMLQEAIIHARSTGIKDLVKKTYSFFFDLYNRMKLPSKALEYHLLMTQVKDSLFNDEKSRIIAEMEAKYESEKKDKEIVLLKKDNEIKKVNQRFLLAAIITLVVMAAMLILLFRMRIRSLHREKRIINLEMDKKALENQRLEEQVFAEQQINRLQTEKLEQQNRELSANVIHIMNKNNALKEILNQMENMRNSQDDDKNKCFNKVSNLINSNLNLDNDWEQFKRHFIEVHPSFFEYLQQKYPSLSPHEQRMCAYLRINLSTKEIAQMLNVTPDAIVKSRYRLKKKMELAPEIDLTEFMGRF
jgi:tetratricopeptide (TPR) repeat protein